MGRDPKALSSDSRPCKIVLDKGGSNAAGIREVNKAMERFGCRTKMHKIKSKNLDTMIEQDHRFVRRRIRHMCGFKSLRSASVTLDGIEVVNMIRRQQSPNTLTSGIRLNTVITVQVCPIWR
ncbi:DDE-type integrase/transposase/recombinase [Ruegeria meonggei]|uniref:DDE-type integrase/transposase/recombinase n=1 Tax=Ruegeria meonggei TaxID=1446476 RepID=UPI0036702E75